MKSPVCLMCGVDCGCGCVLPYSFDLHFDIKTFDQLRFEYESALRKVEGIRELCVAHGVNLAACLKEDET